MKIVWLPNFDIKLLTFFDKNTKKIDENFILNKKHTHNLRTIRYINVQLNTIHANNRFQIVVTYL